MTSTMTPATQSAVNVAWAGNSGRIALKPNNQTSAVQCSIMKNKPIQNLRYAIILWMGMMASLVPSHAAVLAGWDVHSLAGGTGANNFGVSPYPVTLNDANLTVMGLTRGSGVSAPTTTLAAARAWGGVNWQATTAAAAVTANNFVTCSLTAQTGYNVSFSSISQFNYRRSGTGPTTGVLQYQVGIGAFNDVATINYTSSATAGASLAAINLSGIPALQNVPAGTTVTFRIANYGGTGSTGTWYIFDVANSTANDFEISGTVNAVGPIPSVVRVESAEDGSGSVLADQTVAVNSSVTAFSVSRDSSNVYVSNTAATWSLVNKTGSVADTDLVAAADNKSATFTGHGGGTAVIRATVSGLTSTDSGVLTVPTVPTSPSATGLATPALAALGSNVTMTVTVQPGANPTSAGLSVSADLSSIGGSNSQVFYDDGTHGDVTAGDNVFSFASTIPTNAVGGARTFSVAVTDSQRRTASASISLGVLGNIAIFHDNDTHARVTPHNWIVPQHSADPQVYFEEVGGVAFVAGKMLGLVSNEPTALVLNGGDISEGNPVGDWNGPGNPTGTFGNGTVVDYFKLLDTKLRAVSGRGGRGLDAMVVGNHDIRDISYLNNMRNQTNFPVISINICSNGTHNPYFAPYVVVNVNGNKVGIVGYTTESSDSPEAAVTNAITVVDCDWKSTNSAKIHFADYVNELRNTQGCNLVILLTHMGHSGLCTVTGANPTPILVDTAAAKLPEVAITGHWHTFCDSVWQPDSLNYKTIFTEAGSFTHYVSELRINGLGKYISNDNYPLRNSDIVPDSDVAAFIQTRKDLYDASGPDYTLDQVIGYSSDDLLLDNYMKWWSADEYPWSGNNTAGNWICDAMQWKAQILFGQCDLGLESGGGVRSDIPAGPVTFTQIYETFPWADDTLYVVKMTGQEIWNYIRDHGCDAAISSGWQVTGFDGVPTGITNNGTAINLTQTYKVAINNYMYTHDSVPFTDTTPQTSSYLARTALIEYTSQFTEASPYSAGPPRYILNTEFSGGYRAVVTLLNDSDTRPSFEDAFIRFLTATPETLGHRGTKQVPTSLVNSDGSFVATDRLAEIELYRSYLGFHTGALKPGDIIETWGKGSFYQGDPEFVDQEGIYSDGVEFRVVGHDESLAKPTWVPDITTGLGDFNKNHYIKLLVKKTDTSSVVDQYGVALSVKDVTAYANKTLPGSVNDLLVLTGVPTSESFAMRFRCDSAVLASTLGINSFPTSSTVSSSVSPLPPFVSGDAVTLTATASINAGNTYSLGPVADATVQSGNPTATAGSSTTLFIESGSTSFGNERAWLRFDLSSLPAGSAIASAQLQLYCWAAATTSLPVEVRVGNSDTWAEASLNWNGQPTFGNALDTNTLAAGVVNLYYSWDITSLALSKFAGNKLVSVVAKPVTEGNASLITYKFDSKEYGSTPPVLKITTQSSGSATTLAQVQFYYRFSSDNSTWGAWTLASTATTAPYTANFSFPMGEGYYEFHSRATDGNGAVESAPGAAQAFVHHAAVPPYITEAIVSLGNLSQAYDGTTKPASITSLPPALNTIVTYNGSSTVPTEVGSYAVVATVSADGYTGGSSGTLKIGKGLQTITFGSLPTKTVGDASFQLSATASSGLGVSYSSDNPAVATVSDNTVTIVGPGTANITATQPGDAHFNAASPVIQPLTVSAAALPDSSDVPLPLWSIGALAMAIAAVGSKHMISKRLRATGE